MLLKLAAIIFDGVLVNAGIILAFFLRFGTGIPEANFKPYRNLWVFITIIMIAVIYSFELYSRRKNSNAIMIIDNSIRSIFLGTLLIFVAVYSVRLKLGKLPTSIILFSWIINTVLVCGWRLIALRSRRLTRKKLLVVGSGMDMRRLIENIRNNPKWGYELAGIMDESAEEEELYGIKVQKSVKNARNFIIKESINEVILAYPENLHDRIGEIVSHCHGMDVSFKIIPNLYEIFLSRTDGEEIDGLPLVDVTVSPISGTNEILKRVLDIAVSVCGLLLFAPVILILFIINKISDKGGIFYRQERVGKGGKLFNCYKLRTMREGAEEETGPTFAEKNDKRITKIGRLLRMTRMDEIPQLINVLKGDMSLVGPRPERPFFVEKFKKEIAGYVTRLQVKPGITGLAQVNSSYDISIREKLNHDLMYIRNQNVFLDLKIMLRTAWVMITTKGAQ